MVNSHTMVQKRKQLRSPGMEMIRTLKPSQGPTKAGNKLKQTPVCRHRQGGHRWVHSTLQPGKNGWSGGFNWLNDIQLAGLPGSMRSRLDRVTCSTPTNTGIKQPPKHRRKNFHWGTNQIQHKCCYDGGYTGYMEHSFEAP